MKSANAIILTFILLACSSAASSQSRPAPGRKYSTVERLSLDRLRAVHADRINFSKERRTINLETGYTDYRAVMHAHAQDASHTGGTRPELLAAAKSRGVQIVMLTDHVRERDFIDDSWRGLHDGVLFIPGAEDRGFLSFPMHSIKGENPASRDEYIQLVRKDGGNIFLSHVEERLDWPTDQMDGLEIYNHHTDVKDEAEFSFWLQGTLTDAERLANLVRALEEFPEEVFGAQQDYLTAILQKWDRDSQKKPLTGLAANDCHHNQVLTVTVVDDKTVEIGYIGSKPTTKRVGAEQVPQIVELVKDKKPGELMARLDFDPYERSLNYVTTHILARELSESAVRDALRHGHAYVSHDWLCDPSGFAFVAVSVPANPAAGNGNPQAKNTHTKPNTIVMGDEAGLTGDLRLKAATPLTCTMKLIRNGELIQTEKTSFMEFKVRSAGVYRIEAWLEVDGEMRPWIYSNPIYVR